MRFVFRVFLAICALMVPALAPGEVVRLKDASTVRGRLVQVTGDTLVFKSTFGTLRFHRAQVVSIMFDDSAATVVTGVAGETAAPAPAGKGRIEVVFKDRDVSSKIAIELKKKWDEHIASNHIVVELLVNGHVMYSAVDTTMDKQINKGHTTIMKNSAEVADFGVDVPSGMHHATLVIRNSDAKTFREDFDPKPLDMVLAVDNIQIRPGEIYRIDVDISRGKLKVVE
jgi:hypothetical protein